MDQVDKVDRSEGNTETSSLPPKATKAQKRKWIFTWNNPDIDGVDKVDRVSRILDKECVKYQFQYEVGESGTPHYQGYAEFKNGRMLGGLKKLFPKAHWEVAIGNLESNNVYTSKDEGYLAGPWSKGIPKKVRSDITVFKPWQEEAYKLYKGEPDKRKIHWFYEERGNTGKTAFAKHLCLEGESLYVMGKAADIKCAVSEWIKSGKPLKCVCWDIPREKEDYMSYTALEEIKNGIFFSGKYESGMVIFPQVHVFVFANFAPERQKLSKDRWDIKKLDSEGHDDEMDIF